MLDIKKIINELSEEDLSKVTGGNLNKEEARMAFSKIRQFATYQWIYDLNIVAWIREKNDANLTVNFKFGKYDYKKGLYVPRDDNDKYYWKIDDFTNLFDISHEIGSVKWEDKD